MKNCQWQLENIFLDVIASPSSYPCQWVIDSFRLERAIASTGLASLFFSNLHISETLVKCQFTAKWFDSRKCKKNWQKGRKKKIKKIRWDGESERHTQISRSESVNFWFLICRVVKIQVSISCFLWSWSPELPPGINLELTWNKLEINLKKTWNKPGINLE